MNKMVVTDLDGTLLNAQGVISEPELLTLKKLGNEGYCRVIATGRSLYSIRKTLAFDQLPVDYLIFSSGSGIIDE